MSTKELQNEILETDVPVLSRLILYNSHHFWDDVILQVQKATGYDLLHCEQIAMIAHTKGKAVVKSGEKTELQKIDIVLKEIHLVTQIE